MEEKRQLAVGTGGEIVLYQPDESIRLEVKVDGTLNTVWLSIDQMARHR